MFRGWPLFDVLYRTRRLAGIPASTYGVSSVWRNVGLLSVFNVAYPESRSYTYYCSASKYNYPEFVSIQETVVARVNPNRPYFIATSS